MNLLNINFRELGAFQHWPPELRNCMVVLLHYMHSLSLNRSFEDHNTFVKTTMVSLLLSKN